MACYSGDKVEGLGFGVLAQPRKPELTSCRGEQKRCRTLEYAGINQMRGLGDLSKDTTTTPKP